MRTGLAGPVRGLNRPPVDVMTDSFLQRVEPGDPAMTEGLSEVELGLPIRSGADELRFSFACGKTPWSED